MTKNPLELESTAALRRDAEVLTQAKGIMHQLALFMEIELAARLAEHPATVANRIYSRKLITFAEY